MAGKDVNKFINNMIKFVEGEYKRGALDKFPTIVNMTASAIGQGFKEGYQSLEKKKKDYQELEDEVFLAAGQAAVDRVTEWASNPRSSGSIAEKSNNHVVYFTKARDVKVPYNLAKRAGIAYLQKVLGSMQGTSKLKAADKSAGISGRASEIGQVKSAVHRAHQGVTTVGAAQISSAMRFLTQTKAFAGFANSKAASKISDILKQIDATFETTGTKGKPGDQQVSLKENISIAIALVARSANAPGQEDYDFSKLLPKLRDAIKNYVIEAKIENLPGSDSITVNSTKATAQTIINKLTKPKNVRQRGKGTGYKGRKAKNIDKDKKYGTLAIGASKKKAKTVRVAGAARSVASTPLRAIGLINKQLPDVIRKNMQQPALQNRTGRFSENVKITDVIQTPKGHPSFGYTYQKNPYQIFEMGNGTPPWATPERDPRKLIERSIREIAAQFAIGRFYTRRV